MKADFEEQRAPRGRLGRSALLLVVLNLILALPSLDNGFSLDDYNWLERAAFRTSTIDFLVEPEPGQVLNPVGRGVFLAIQEMAGSRPLPYRVVVLLLHTLNAILLLLLADRLFGHAYTGLLAAVLFSLQTSYDEALFWIAAFFHPLNATFFLGTLLAFVVYQETGSRRSLWTALFCFVCGLWTKAPSFALLFLLPFLPRRPRATSLSCARAVAPFFAVWIAASALNLLTGLGGSYLLSRGFYRPGWHIAGHFGDYLAWMLFPFSGLAERLGLSELADVVLFSLEWLAPIAVLLGLLRSNAPIRSFLLLTVVALAPFLPFVAEPASRYTYLPAAGVAAVLASAAMALARRGGVSRTAGRAVCLVILATLVLASYAERRLRDNHYEHRERLMATWVADVLAAQPTVPANRTLSVVGFPKLAIDPGIHFEAALRLAYREPKLRLQIPTDTETPSRDALYFREGRITAPSAGD